MCEHTIKPKCFMKNKEIHKSNCGIKFVYLPYRRSSFEQ